MHELLKRQIKRFLGDKEPIPEKLQKFIEAVSEAYEQSDNDRKMLDRSLDLSSRELNQANSDLRAIFQSSPDVYFRLDKSGLTLDYYPGKATIPLVSGKTISGKNLQDIFPPGVKEKIQDKLNEVASKKSLVSAEIIFEDNQELQFLEARFYPLLNDQIMVVIRDETKRVQAEEVLQFQNEIMKNVAEGIVVTRASDAIIVNVNPKFEEMFGYAPREITGKNIAIVNAPSDKSHEEAAKVIQKSLRETGIWQGEVRNIKKDGTVFWCYANVSTFKHFRYGEVWVAVHADITERKKVGDALKGKRSKI